MKDNSNFLSWAKALFFLVFAIALVPVALTVFMQYGQGGWYQRIKAEVTNQPYARTVTVSGEGKVAAVPDIARITLAVTSTGKTVKEVTLDGNTKMNRIVDTVKKLGVKAEDIKTSEYNLSPQYDYTVYSEGKAPKILGYNLTQSADVKIRDLQKVDDILDQSIQAGANQVGSLNFEFDDDSKFKNDAREEAFQKAREKAESMAKAAGVRIGRVITFNEEYSPVYAVYDRVYALGAAESKVAPAPTVEPGSQELVVNVSVTYEID